MNTFQANPAMPSGNQCPRCGAPLPAGALAGLCPACLLKQGAAADTAPAPGAAPFTPPPVAELSKLFPQLEILSLIGQGGMGAVYKARQPALDRFVALKILPPQAAPGVNFAERFNREARALAKISHPNIVAVYDFGQAGALHYFIMEFVDGANLRQLIRTGRLAPREALAVVPQICDALQFAHDEGVVHRDIKPENIRVDRRGRVKITDFGLAKILGIEADASRLTREGQVMGTPHYMAPEQVEHPQTVDHRADIYSLGVVFYEMLTGELPLGKFPVPSQKVQVDVRLDEVVLHALEKEPERRYQQASQVKTAVETIVTSAPPDKEGCAWQQPTSGWGWLVGKIFGITFTSPLAYKCANLSALGFLGALGCLGYVSPEWRWCFGFFGSSGLFGLVGVAHLIEMVSRHRPRTTPPPTAKDLPLFVEQDGRRYLCWPGVFLLCGTVGLVVMGANLAIALLLWLLNAPVRLTFTTGELMLALMLLGACALMRLTASKLAAHEAATVNAQPTAKPGTAMAFIWTVVVVMLSAAVAGGMAFFISWIQSVLAKASTDGDWLSHISRITRVGVSIGLLALGGLFFIHSIVRAAFRQRPPPPPVAPPQGGTPTVGVPASAGFDVALRQVNGPAIGLIATAILNWIAIPAIVMAMVFVGAGPNSLISDGLIVVPIAAFVLCTVMLVGALKMKRLESQTWAVAASMLAMFIAPGNIIGLPLGIWAMFVLGRPEVRAAFRRKPQPQEPTPNDTLLGRLALGLFLGGLLGTILIMAVSPWQAMALVFGAVALVLALVFGVMGRRERLGRLAVFCALVALVGVPASFFSAFWTEQACSIVTMLPRAREEEREHIERAEAAKKAALARMPQITQSVSKDIQLDGTIRFKLAMTQRNTGSEPLRTLRFANSDFIRVDKLADAQGRAMPFAVTRAGQMTLRYEAALAELVKPGAEFSYVMEGAETGLVKPLTQPGEFEYTMRHWPGDIRTRRIERHLLPASAQLLNKEPADLTERARDGRIELFIDRVIPSGDSLEIRYTYRLQTKP